MQIEKKKSKLDEAIDQLLDELITLTGDDPMYAKTADQLKKLYEIKDNTKPDRIKLDTLVTVGGNIAIAVMIIAFEQQHVITTKLPAFLSKIR